MIDQTSFESYIEGPRWEDLSGFVLKLGMICNVRVVVTKETKSWFRKTTFYTVSGNREQVITFLRRVRDSVEDYNREEAF